MYDSFEVLTSNPVYMAVAVVLAIIILMGVIKKLIKLALLVAAVLVLWIAYMSWTGQDVNIDKLKKSVQIGVESMGNKANELGGKMKDSAQKKIEKKVEEKLDDLFDH